MYYIIKFSEHEVAEILKACPISIPYCVFPLTGKRCMWRKLSE